MNKTAPLHYNVLLGLFLIIHLLLFWYFGIRTLYDSNIYTKSADFLLLNGHVEKGYHIFYFVPISMMSLFRCLLPGNTIFYLISQCIISGFATLLLYRASSKIFDNTLAGFLSAFIFLIWLDNIQWNTAVMTESLFCSFICCLIYVLSRFNGSVKHYCLILALLFILFFTRPTGIVIIIGTIVFILHYYRLQIKKKPILKFTIFASLIMAGFMSGFMMFSIWDFTEQYRKGNIVTYMDVIEGTSMYRKNLRLSTHDVVFMKSNAHPLIKMCFFIINNPAHFFKSAILKVWYLLSFIRPYYSWVHNAYSTVWLSVIYTLLYFGLRRVSAASLKYFVLAVVLVNCSLVAISTIDWDNRFYVPMVPGISLLAGGGAAYVIGRLRSKKEFNR